MTSSSTMRVAVGPLPSAWVRAWVLDASESMRRASVREVSMPFAVGDDFFTRSFALAAEWSEVAAASDVFVWSGDDDPDAMLTTIQYWRNLAQVRHDLVARGEAPAMDADAERFTHALRRAILDALVASRRLSADHADRLEASWPALSAPSPSPSPSAAGDGDVAQDERHARGAAR